MDSYAIYRAVHNVTSRITLSNLRIRVYESCQSRIVTEYISSSRLTKLRFDKCSNIYRVSKKNATEIQQTVEHHKLN
jgi:hypothetical protein